MGSVPEKALEDNKWLITISDVTSKSIATRKIKDDYIIVRGNHFPIPFTYALDINMLIGYNCIRHNQ